MILKKDPLQVYIDGDWVKAHNHIGFGQRHGSCCHYGYNGRQDIEARTAGRADNS